MENNNKSGSHDISKIRSEVENYLNMNYGGVKGKKNIKSVKRGSISNSTKFKFMEEVLGPFKNKGKSTKKKIV